MAGARRRTIDRGQHHRHRHLLAGSLTRFLHITRRRVPLDQRSAYQHAWQRVHAAAAALGARAWIFTAVAAPGHFTEFIEWQSAAGDTIIEHDSIVVARRHLDAAFPFEESETWKEAQF